MATNTYKCTVCKRQVERVENVYGLDTFSKCIITGGCHGKLRRTGRNLDNIRESFPKFEVNLEDYVPRNAFAQHKQDIAAPSWTITHGLNCEPVLVVFALVAGAYVRLDDSQYVTSTVNRNTTRIEFPTATAGLVQFIARSSTTIASKPAAPPAERVQVTVNGNFVFAVPTYVVRNRNGVSETLDMANRQHDIRVEVIIEEPNKEEMWCFETISGVSELTPWSSIDEVLVAKRKNYFLHSKSILKFTTFNNPDLRFTDIPEGTRLRFITVDYGTGISQPLESKGLLVLLSSTPYEHTDRVRNKLLDIGELALSKRYLTYSNGEFYAEVAAIEKTYPPIEAARKMAPLPPLPTQSATPTPSPTPTPTPTQTPTPTPTQTPTPSPVEEEGFSLITENDDFIGDGVNTISILNNGFGAE